MAQKKKQKRSVKNRSHGQKSKAKVTQLRAKGRQSKESREGLQGSEEDIIKLILEHHKPLKEMIETLKDEDTETEEKMACFEEFAPTLVAHAKPEEQTLYRAMKENDDLRSEGFEGEVEHTLTDQLLEEIKRTKDEDEWCAKVKVIAELLEHHIEEEEETLLPDYKKESEKEEREELGREYMSLREQLIDEGSDDAPQEEELEEEAS